MIALDTNVLLRFVTADDESQHLLAKKLILKYKGKNKSIYINQIVLCDLVWVLKSGYKYTKAQIVHVLQMIVGIAEFSFSEIDWIFEAILLYKNATGDFSDCLIHVVNKNNKCQSTFSFDKKAIKDGLFKEL